MSAMVYLGIEVGDDLSGHGDSHRLQLLMTGAITDVCCLTRTLPSHARPRTSHDAHWCLSLAQLHRNSPEASCVRSKGGARKPALTCIPTLNLS